MAKNVGLHIKKKKHSPGARLLAVIGGVVALYFIGQVYSVITNGVDTVSAAQVTVDDDITVTGYFVRNEEIVDGTAGETVEHTVHSGEKVRRGSQLAVEYTDKSALETSRKVQALNDQITLLQAAVDAASDLTDTAKLDQLITSDMQSLAQEVRDGMAGELDERSGDLRQLLLRRGIDGQNTDTLQTQIKTLTQQKDSLQKSISTQTKAITSPYDGFYSETVDGYEGVLKASELTNLTADGFAQKLSAKPQDTSAALGKVIEGFDWYFAALVPGTSVSGMHAGQGVSLRFSQLTETIPATVYAIRPSEDGTKTLLILKSNRINSELVTMRKQVADVIRGTYTGIKVPKDAIRMVNGKLGVYTLNGSISRFKPIAPLYEGDTFYVIAQTSVDDKGVVAHDNIIVKGRELEDKKVVKK